MGLVNLAIRTMFCVVDAAVQHHCIDTKGLIYDGKVSVTQQNVECQRLDSQYPHAHKYTDQSQFPDATLADAANYCGAPDGRDRPWCFTTSAGQHWDYCDFEAIFWGMQAIYVTYYDDLCYSQAHTIRTMDYIIQFCRICCILKLGLESCWW